MIGVALIGLLSANLDTGDRLARVQNDLNELFDLLGYRGHGFANRKPDVLGYRNTADLRQPLLHLHVPAIK
jgi:hypothetical protein